MKKNRLLLFVVVVLLLLTAQCFESGEKNVLPVPYFAMTQINWCGIACVHMWSHYEGYTSVTQNEIANELGIEPGETAPPHLIAQGVQYFTDTSGFFALRFDTGEGAQGDLIAATEKSIRENDPAIMPFGQTHTVLIIGYKWQDDENDRPIAEKAWYHDPRGGLNNESVSIGTLKTYFEPAPDDYWVILASEWYFDEGPDRHDAFVLEGGTYYGGPLHYDPKGLTPDPHMN